MGTWVVGYMGTHEFGHTAKAQVSEFQNSRQEMLAHAEWQVQERSLEPL
jgi:hypothetical protein